jgi:hypothetical protein
MNDEALNMSIRRFLKQFGVSAQREIEQAVRGAFADGKLAGTESIPVRATLRLEGLGGDFQVDGLITLE